MLPIFTGSYLTLFRPLSLVKFCVNFVHKKYKTNLYSPFQNESCLRTEDILKIIEEQGDSIALIMFAGNLESSMHHGRFIRL